MKKSSIFVSITFIFFIAFVAIAMAAYLFLKYDRSNYLNTVYQKYEILTHTITWQLQTEQNPDEIYRQIEKLGLTPITYPKEIAKIITAAKVIDQKNIPIGEIKLLQNQKDFYILVQSFANLLLLKYAQYEPYRQKVIISIFSIIALSLLFVYIATIMKLRPLKKIEKELKKFSKGELDLDLDIKGSSEIAQVASALKEATDSIKNLLESRKLLLRNVMHELKTPIAKGRIASEMIEDEKQKKRFIKIFERLNSLINELAALEAVDSKIEPELKRRAVRDIINEAIELGMFDKKEVEKDIEEDFFVNADSRLFSIAVKNLLENGIKHSSDHKVKIGTKKGSIFIESRGEPLKREIEYYLQPFSKESRSEGFGLGLFIVSKILALHGFKLSYKYKDGRNIFTISTSR
ncbi:ArsS family sensor histidine kinase [Nitrosophilus alvini]|uniref:ArsS family sensor histidine kinase n=1 Tax=Nitrosophilus alvini TaxID=2714855 RepID=UPI00190DAED4|nr:ArsS family sensor histidine kinase [Nitrosophilus alvini]